MILENSFTGNSTLTYCWDGDLNSTGFGVNVGMGSYDAASLNFNWQREYVFAPSAVNYKYLNQVVADANGYVAEGNWWNGTTHTTDNAVAGEMFFVRTDKGGGPLWSRRLNQVFVNQRSHNSGMLIDKFNGSDVIYAVGFKKINNVTQGILVQIPITGKMDTACTPVQTLTPLVRDYSVPDSISTLKLAMADSVHYYPIDCVTTKDSVTCDNPCIPPVLKSADFQLAGVIPIGVTNTFQVTASLFSTAQNSRWIVSGVDPVTGNDITSPNTVQTSLPGGTLGSVWGAATPTSFGSYYSPLGAESSGFGTFLQLHKCRFRHIVSAADNCGIIYSDTVTKSIYMCTSCRARGVFTVETENAKSDVPAKSSTGFKVDNIVSNTIVYPNPANGSITFALSVLQANNPVLQILNAGGQVMKTVKVNSGTNISIGTASWASGAYVYQVIAGGNIISKGNFAVSH